MENKPVLWDKDSEVSQSLRLPKGIPKIVAKTEHAQTNIQFVNNQLESLTIKKKDTTEDIVAKSTLKVDAPEWYPNGFYSGSHKSFAGFNKHNLPYKSENNDYLQNQMNETNYHSPDINRLKQIINTLTKDPGQFDNLLNLFMETLQPYFEDILFLSDITQLLVDQAITNPNFIYTGARLCWYIEQNCPEFRADLHLKCKRQVEGNMHEQSVLLFIAELYTQLPHLTMYGALLIDCYKQLLRRGGNDNIKCICQALKLTGYSLESSNRNELDEVFAQLKSAKELVNGSVINLINSVINLRTSNWGYTSETSNEENHITETYEDGELGSTTFYRPDGDAFTTEEREFLTAHLDSTMEDSEYSDPDDLCDPEPEMDQEIQEAFKEFVQLSKH